MDQSEFARIVADAQAGRSAAQEALAEIFAGAGDAEQARHWLTRAASGSSDNARIRLGLWEVVGFGGPRDVQRGLSRLLRCARAGEAEAAHTLAVLFTAGIGAVQDRERGLKWLAQAARDGHIRATAQLGVMIGSGNANGLALLERAAAAGSAVAMHTLGCTLPDARGRAWASAAAAAGHPRVRSSATLIEPPRLIPDAEPHWEALVDEVDLGWVDATILRSQEREEPYIESLRDVLPIPVCEYVIGLAAPALVRGKIVDKHGRESVSDIRANAVMNFGVADSDLLLELINLKAARAAGLPPANAEGLGVLHYRTGESYAPHVDYVALTAANAAQLAARGQRVATLLVYLNEDFEGGETTFPALNAFFKPPAGSALLFHSVDREGRPDPRTVHTDAAPVSGEKWAISKWFRTRALRPGAG